MKNLIQINYLFFLVLILGNGNQLFAEATFTTSNTITNVSTVAGADHDIGITQPPSQSGSIDNVSFSEVKQNDQGDGGGQASAQAKVSKIDADKLFAVMQVTASTLPQDGAANSEASVTFAFNNPGSIIVSTQIRQGNVGIFIDGIKQVSSSPFDVVQGQHKFEIRAQTDSVVVNPNFGILVDFIEESSGQPAEPTAVPETPNGNNNPTGSSTSVQLNNLITAVGNVKPAKSKEAKAALGLIIAQVKADTATFTDSLIAANVQVTGKASLKSLADKVKKTIGKLKSNKTSDELKIIKKDAKKALQALLKALGL